MTFEGLFHPKLFYDSCSLFCCSVFHCSQKSLLSSHNSPVGAFETRTTPKEKAETSIHSFCSKSKRTCVGYEDRHRPLGALVWSLQRQQKGSFPWVTARTEGGQMLWLSPAWALNGKHGFHESFFTPNPDFCFCWWNQFGWSLVFYWPDCSGYQIYWMSHTS